MFNSSKPIRKSLLLMLAVAVGANCGWNSVPTATASAEEISSEKVVKAINGGIAFLKRKQTAKGTWPSVMNNVDGPTALCTLALLNAGVPAKDPVIQKALTHLRGIQPKRTYVVSLQTMVFCVAEPKRDLARIRRNVKWLERTQIQQKGHNLGSWGYGDLGGGDNSNAQFAVLALHEAERAGVEVSLKTWNRAYSYWKKSQRSDGSWNYVPNTGGRGGPGTGSMTCAGIGALVITSQKINTGDASVENGKVLCCGKQENEDAIDKGIAWLGKHFSVKGNPTLGGAHPMWHYYYLYALERTGRLTGHRFIGKHDWYREGADYLILKGKANFEESWSGTGLERRPTIATALSLLFLSKGRRPVVMAKVKHGPGEDWNHHRNDTAHLVAFTERAWKMDLTWQVYDTDAATVEDLLQAPVLFISGSQAPRMQGQEKKLRDYIDRGGFIFAEACCKNGKGFDRGFRELMAKVFPEKEYELRLLEPEHPAWYAEKRVRPDSPYIGRLWGIEYGCRTSVIFCESDLSCYWELSQLGRKTGYPKEVDQHIDDALAIGVNVLTYATNREPRHKDENFGRTLKPLAADNKSLRGVVQVAKLQHGGGCNDAPGALANLIRTASRGELKLRIANTEHPISPTDKNLRPFHLLFMHGRHDFRFTPQERKAIKLYLERGGTLLVDSICASKPFTEAFRREMKSIFPENKLKPIGRDEKLLTTEFGGYDIRRVKHREPQANPAKGKLTARTRTAAPTLEGIQVEGRWAVIFSPYDLSCALEQHDSLKCRGYTREDAARIALNVVVYMLNQ